MTELRILKQQQLFDKDFTIYGTIENQFVDEEEQIKIRPKHSLGQPTSTRGVEYVHKVLRKAYTEAAIA